MIGDLILFGFFSVFLFGLLFSMILEHEEWEAGFLGEGEMANVRTFKEDPTSNQKET